MPDGIWGLPRAAMQGNKLRRLKLDQQRDLLDLFTKSARDFLDAWFESDEIKALLGFDSIVGNYASPDTPGSAYVLLHHTFGGVNGKKGNWGHAMGGMGAITPGHGRRLQKARRGNHSRRARRPVARRKRPRVRRIALKTAANSPAALWCRT